jgi:NTP pyrophosphatase (non-canonical NTP hydrolase)
MENKNGMIKPEMTLVQLANQCKEDSTRWFPLVAEDIPHHMLSLAGEVGELANIVKKIQRGDLDYKDAMVRHDAAMELTDIFIYVLNIAALMRVNLYESYKVKRNENDKRFTKKEPA